MSLGFQKSKQQQTNSSDSSQQQYGMNESTSFGNTGSTSASTSVGGSAQSVFGSDIFSNLYSGAAGAAGGINTDQISQAAQQLFSGGLGFLGQLNQNSGTDALQARLTDDSALNAQLAALRQSTGDFLTENLLPGVTSRGVATGTLGSSRDALAQSLAVKQAAGQFNQGAAQLIGTNQQQKDAAAAALAGIQGQNAATGLGALGSLFNLNSAGATAGLAPYQQLAAILGGPTTLTTSNQVASSLSDSFGTQGSQSYGFDYGTQKSHSEGQGTQSSFGIQAGVSGGFGGSSVFSDRRLKKDITRVGTKDGIPVYTYRYKWDGPDSDLRFGVMADEVEHIKGAVAYDENGYALVNYAKVFS